MTESSGFRSDKSEHVTFLCQKIIQGDHKAENEFVTLHYRWLLFIVRKKFNGTDLHMDIVQDAFILVIAKLKKQEVNQLKTIRAYLRTCAINIGYEYLRKNKKYVSAVDQDYLDFFEDEQAGILDQMEWQEGVDHVKQVIDELPTSRDRDILTQFYFEDQDKLQVCENLDLSPTHFDRVIYRAKQRLKALIEQNSERNDDFTTPDKEAKKDNMKINNNSKSTKLIPKLMAWLCAKWESLFNVIKNRRFA